MNRAIPAFLLGLGLAAASAGDARAQGRPAYPNVDKPYAIAEGDTVQLLIRFMNDGGPSRRPPGKRLDLVYSTSIPASNAEARRAQADRAAQAFGRQAMELGVRQLSIGICDTRECAERKHPPSEWYLYDRTSTGWKRAP